jgi:hypothetical protein
MAEHERSSHFALSHIHFPIEITLCYKFLHWCLNVSFTPNPSTPYLKSIFLPINNYHNTVLVTILFQNFKKPRKINPRSNRQIFSPYVRIFPYSKKYGSTHPYLSRPANPYIIRSRSSRLYQLYFRTHPRISIKPMPNPTSSASRVRYAALSYLSIHALDAVTLLSFSIFSFSIYPRRL